MLDLETMGTGSDAAIVSIGAVAFDEVSGELGDEFYQVVDLQSSIDAGGTVTASTIMFWIAQSDAARDELLSGSEMSIKDTLFEFRRWLLMDRAAEDIEMWGNGATFDNVILSNAYKRLGVPRPWGYRGDRCYRTLKALYKSTEAEPVGIEHHALDDAKYQARIAIKILRKMNGLT